MNANPNSNPDSHFHSDSLPRPAEPSDEVVLDVNNVWKVYCRNLKKAMWYGLCDLGREVLGRGRDRTHEDLRPMEFFAVRNANFQIKRGEAVGLIGPNGAGKSTMLKMINGLVRPDAGEIKIKGKVGALIELGTGFNPILSGRENVYINAAVLGLTKAEVDERFHEIVDFAELADVIDDPVKTYSSGMRVRLGFSVAANLKPDLLILDEVLAVGDVGFRMKCFTHLRKLVDEGVSLILVTHAVSMLQRVANRTVVFGQGKIVHDGDLQSGSSVYEEMMQASEAKMMAKEKRVIKRDAWLDKITVCNEKGGPKNEFQTGDPLVLRLELKSKIHLPNARLVVALASPVHGGLASMSTPYQEFRFDLTPQGLVVQFKIDRLPLLIGAYYFNVSLYGARNGRVLPTKAGNGKLPDCRSGGGCRWSRDQRDLSNGTPVVRGRIIGTTCRSSNFIS